MILDMENRNTRSKKIETPNIDKLAKKGINLTNRYRITDMCSFKINTSYNAKKSIRGEMMNEWSEKGIFGTLKTCSKTKLEGRHAR